MDDLAAAAGVTSGSIYSNFGGKEEVLKEIVATCLGEKFLDTDVKERADWQQHLEKYLRAYLSPKHRRDATGGCLLPALSADVSRASAGVRSAYRDKVSEMIEKMSKALNGSPTSRRKRAWSVLALMVGAITVARALPDESNADEIVQAALESALSMLEG